MNQERILFFGRSGQLAQAFSGLIGTSENFFGQEQFDLIKNYKEIVPFVKKNNPTIIINTSAYTAVDLAETEKQAAEIINAYAPYEMAKAAKQLAIPLVHFSTDYVFDGTKDKPYVEDDSPSPINLYGQTKLQGENFVRDTWEKHYIFRVSWLYSQEGKNFFNTMLRLGQEKKELNIVNDQIGAPTYVYDVAELILKALSYRRREDYGIYHLTNQGECTWYEFAVEIFRLAKEHGIDITLETVNPISSDKFPTVAKRPCNSLLSNEKFNGMFSLTMPSWKESLKKCFSRKVESV